jgi:hypothetical protein
MRDGSGYRVERASSVHHPLRPADHGRKLIPEQHPCRLIRRADKAVLRIAPGDTVKVEAVPFGADQLLTAGAEAEIPDSVSMDNT